MNNTFTININGNLFFIEEEAFHKLQDYLQLLKRFFENQDGEKEIMSDIEARIAELLQEKMNQENEVVTSGWVDELIIRMGMPEDFMGQAQNSSSELKGEKIRKRLYRDNENHVLAGVCSGISAYLNCDPVLVRILFVVLFVVSIGTSSLIYLILWVVVPKAHTVAQRLEMRGEDVTIANIQKIIQEELAEVKSSISNFNKSGLFLKFKGFVFELGQACRRFINGFGKVMGIVLGSMLIITGFFGFVTFLVSVAVGNSVVTNNSIAIHPEVDLSGVLGFLMSPGLLSISILLLILLVGIPLLAIFFIGTKLVFRFKINNKLIGLGALGVWLMALIAMIAITLGQVNNYKEKGAVSSGETINCPTCKTLYLELKTNQEMNFIENKVQFDAFTVVRINGENVLKGIPRLQLQAGETEYFSVVVKRSTRGENVKDVKNNLDQIQYTVSSKDSMLILDPFFTLGSQAKWRDQDIQIIVKVPRGKFIHLGQNLDQLHLEGENLNHISDQDVIGKTWQMTSEGLQLKEFNIKSIQ